MQLYPKKLIPEGYFIGENTIGARLFRAQVAVLGIFFVFCGAVGALYAVATFIPYLGSLWWAVGVPGAVFAVFHVRGKVNERGPHKSDNPHGWWP